MWKSPTKYTTRSTGEKVGCMHGLLNVFYFQPGSNSQKLLTDRRRRSVLSFRTWYQKKRNKLKLLTYGEEKLERSNRVVHTKKRNLSPSSFNPHSGGRVPKIRHSTVVGSKQQDGDLEAVKRNTCLEGRAPKIQDLIDAGCEQVTTDSGGIFLVESNTKHMHKTSAVVSTEVANSARITTSSESNESTTNEACTCLGQLDVQLSKDDPVLQKTLDEVLENLILNSSNPSDNTSNVVVDQSEDLEKVLKTLKSNKELLLKVLQDPKIQNLLLARHIQNLRVVHGTHTDKTHTAELHKLEDIELSESKCERSGLENISKENDVPQKLSRIVVLKPNPIRNPSSSDVIDPESPSQSSQSSSPIMEEFLPFHFLIQEIKKKLKQVFGVSQKNQWLVPMDGGSENFKAPDLGGSSCPESLPQTSEKKSQFREIQSCNEHGNSYNGRSRFSNIKGDSRKFEDLLDTSEYKWSYPSVNHEEHENAVASPRQLFWSLGQETITEQLAQSDKKLERLVYTTGISAEKLHIPSLDPEIVTCHVQETTSSSEASSAGDFDSFIDEIGTKYVQVDSSAVVISQHDNKRSVNSAQQCQHDKLTPYLSMDLSEEQLKLVPNTPTIVRTKNNKKLEEPSPVSVLDSLLLDKIIKPRSIKREHDEFGISPQKIHFEDNDDFNVAIASPNLVTNQQTCVGDDEFKFGYMRALVKAAGLYHFGPSKKDNSNQLLDPSLYDEIETPSGEVPDDLKLLFDCINEVLEEIHDRSSSCMPWVSFVEPIVRPFPTGEQLIQEAQRGLNIHFSPWFPVILEGIVKKDLDIEIWIDLRSGVEEIGTIMGDKILDMILEETILELWG